MTRRSFLKGLGLLTGAAALASVKLPAFTQPGKTVVVGLEAEPTSLDPAQISDFNSFRATFPMFDTLPQFKPGTTEVEPGLAESWTIEREGRRYVFQLRRGVKFHDGTPFNAEVVKINIERQIDPNHPFALPGAFVYAGFTFGEVESVEVVDEFRVAINLKSTFAPFIRNMAIGSAMMVSPAAMEKFGADIGLHPVGTGPFKFVEWVPGQQVVLERNPEYWDKTRVPKIDRLIFRPIVNPQSRVAALEAGEVDIIVSPPPQALEALRANPAFNVAEFEAQHTWYLVLNNQTEPFNSKLVRQAVHHAIDKEAIVRDILLGTATVARTSPLPPSVLGYNPNVKIYDYNPDKARELLRQAGYPNGFEIDFWVPESGSGMQLPVEIGTAIQAFLQQVGIKARIQTFEWGTYLEKTFVPDPKQYPAMHELSWIMDNGDPDNFLYVLLSGEQWPPAGFNNAFYKNETVDELLRKARVTFDEEERRKLYEEAQVLIAEDSPWVWVDHGKEIFPMTAQLTGVVFQPTQGVLRFEQADKQ
jgi:peptide/nickel transport system substrate-binding protein